MKRYNYNLINPKFDKDTNTLEFVHKYISNLKSLLTGAYHGISIQYMSLFLEEFTWRFNQRTVSNNSEKLSTMITSVFNTGVKLQEISKQNMLTH